MIDTFRGWELPERAGSRVGSQAAWCFAFGLWNLLSCLVLLRRWEGALIQPLLGSQFCAVVIWVLCTSGLFRWSADAIGLSAWRHVVWPLSCVSGAGILAAVSFGRPLHGLTLAGWLLWILVEGMWTTRMRIGSASRSGHPIVRTARVTADRAEQLAHNRPSDMDLPEGVTQRLERARHDSGETLTGLLRVEFGVEERLQTVHVSFCPPFDAMPELHVGQISGPTVSLTVAQLETFGARIEARRGVSQSEPSSIVLQLEVSAQIGKAQ